MSIPDIRWQQRFANYQRALKQLSAAGQLTDQRPLSDLEKQGMIQAFEYTYELAWKTLKDFLTYQGFSELIGSRDTLREAFRQELIADGEGWMQMLNDRNRTSHTYNEATAAEILQHIQCIYLPLFLRLQTRLNGLLPQTSPE